MDNEKLKARREYQRQWRLAHPDRVKAAQQKSYLKHREQRIEKCKRYNAEHRDIIIARASAWNKEHRELLNERAKLKYHAKKLKPTRRKLKKSKEVTE